MTHKIHQKQHAPLAKLFLFNFPFGPLTLEYVFCKTRIGKSDVSRQVTKFRLVHRQTNTRFEKRVLKNETKFGK